MFEIDKEFSKVLLDAKVQYNSFNEAVKLAKTHEAKEEYVQSLVKKKQELRQVYLSYEEKVLERMEWDSNIVKIGEGWYGVRYQNERNKDAIKLEILIEKDIPMLERDTSKQRDYNRIEIDTTLPAYLDEAALEVYKQDIARRAIEIVHDYASITLFVPNESHAIKEVKASSHAGKRWVQRVLQVAVNETEAEEYRRLHLEEVEKGILDQFETATCVWRGADGIFYWFDEHNIVYVVGNDTIITLYEEDFGFNKEINRSIVLMQIEVLRKSKKELNKTEMWFQSKLDTLDRELDDISSEILMLEARLNLSNSKKSRLLADKEESGRTVRLEREKFNAQYSKLFKRWEDR